MDVGAELWIFFFGGVAITGAGWLLWVRFIGMPRHDPTSSPAPPGDPTALDLRHHDPSDPLPT